MTTIDLLIAASTLVGLAIVSATALIGWQNWLALKDRELELRRVQAGGDPGRPTREGAARIELADLKERVRRLEAIANGVDL